MCFQRDLLLRLCFGAETHQLEATTSSACATRLAPQKDQQTKLHVKICWACSCILIYLPVPASGSNRCCIQALLLYHGHDLRKQLADVSDVHTCGRIRAAEAKAKRFCCTMGLFCRLLLRTAQALDNSPLAACIASRGMTSATVSTNQTNGAVFKPFDACYAGDSQDHT
jgi:hypothetical protein